MRPRHLHGDLTLFQLREQDVIDYMRDSPTAVWQATNIDQLAFPTGWKPLWPRRFPTLRRSTLVTPPCMDTTRRAGD